MMKNVIFCVALGAKNKMYELSIKSIKQYAKKVDADFIVHETPYFNIDWDIINQTLENATFKIKLDSLQNSYSEIAGSLESLIRNMKENKQTSVPDTDITIMNLEERNKQIQVLLNKIKGLLSKKVIHL